MKYPLLQSEVLKVELLAGSMEDHLGVWRDVDSSDLDQVGFGGWQLIEKVSRDIDEDMSNQWSRELYFDF